jgi:hypothetical protein
VPAYIIETTNLSFRARPVVEYFVLHGWLLQSGKYLTVSPFLVGSGVYPGRPRQPQRLDVFVMSMCPFANGALRPIAETVRDKKFPKDVDLSVHYIVNAASITRTAEGVRILESLLSQHGNPEVEENIRQLAIKKLFPDQWAKYIFLRSYNFDSTYWDDTAREAGIDDKAVRTLARSDEGKKMLREDALLAAQMGILGSPTFIWENRELLGLKRLEQLTGVKWDGAGYCR